MELDDINIVGFQRPEAGLNIFENGLFRLRVRLRLRRHIYLVTSAFQCLGDDFLVLAAHVSSRRIDIVDTVIKGDLHHLRLRCQHRPKAYDRDLHACSAEGSVDRRGKDEGFR